MNECDEYERTCENVKERFSMNSFRSEKNAHAKLKLQFYYPLRLPGFFFGKID